MIIEIVSRYTPEFRELRREIIRMETLDRAAIVAVRERRKVARRIRQVLAAPEIRLAVKRSKRGEPR